MKKTIVLYCYLYERNSDKWGAKVNNRELSYYSLTADKLDKSRAAITKSDGSYEYEGVLGSAFSGGKLYINFNRDTKFEKGELVRIEIL